MVTSEDIRDAVTTVYLRTGKPVHFKDVACLLQRSPSVISKRWTDLEYRVSGIEAILDDHRWAVVPTRDHLRDVILEAKHKTMEIAKEIDRISASID